MHTEAVLPAAEELADVARLPVASLDAGALLQVVDELASERRALAGVAEDAPPVGHVAPPLPGEAVAVAVLEGAEARRRAELPLAAVGRAVGPRLRPEAVAEAASPLAGVRGPCPEVPSPVNNNNNNNNNNDDNDNNDDNYDNDNNYDNSNSNS